MNRALRRQQKKLAKKGVHVGSQEFMQILQTGLQHHKAGNLPAAEQHYQQALKMQPDHPDANHLMGTLAHQAGRNDLALPYLNKAIAAHPQNANFHNIKGLVLKNLGENDAAEVAYKEAIRIDPKFAAAHNGLGLLYKDAEKLDEALQSTQKAIELQSNFLEAYNNLGNIYEAQGALDKAIETYEKTLSLNADFVPARYNYARALQQKGDDLRALEIYQGILKEQPDFPEALSNYGLVLRGLKRSSDAIAPLQRAAELQPQSEEHYYNLGLALMDIGHNAEAIECFEGATTIQPEYPHAHNDHGNALLAMGRASDAIPHFQKALEYAPNSSGMHNNLGGALVRSGRLQEAQSSFERALELKPDFAEAHNNLGNLHQELGEFEQAHSCFERALVADPLYLEAHSNMLFALNYDPDKSGEEIFTHYRAYEERFARPLYAMQKPHTNNADPNRRIKIGYVAPTFYKHAVSFFLLPLFDLANHDEFEIYAYANLSKADHFTEQYRDASDHFILTKGMSDEELAERIRADEIDILVDIAGHANDSRLGVFARKPAPVSLHWLDFGYTTGLSSIDYYLGDPVVTPEGQDHLFGEKEVWRIDGPSFVYRPAEGMGEVGPLPALEKGYITFGTLSRSVRINEKTVKAWAEILKRVPNSKLRADSRNFADPVMCDRLAARFAKHGIERDRLIMGFNSPPWDVLRDMDIALDCFPHNSGTTLYEHLYMGNPVVTLYGRASVGTLGGTIVSGAGFGEWVAKSEEEYVDIATNLASDLDTLSQTRETMREKFKASELMNERLFVDRFENAFRQMWQRWCEKA
ncbi:tetratricopeptide repeat protein [Maritalea porphyrae]|nr:tetratricopeptide repeat protein [Maritalea porphyrae]